jgi:putative hydrolase of HD superfamily
VDPERIAAFLQDAAYLKAVPRTGWFMRGVPEAETVAEHTWGVALVTLVLAQGVEAPIDREKALSMALLHDLPERVLSDIPAPAERYFPPGAKRDAEEAILAEMLAVLPAAESLQAWWREFEDRSSLEGRLVRDADRLDLLIQARLYEESRGSRLDEFWDQMAEYEFYFPLAQAIYEAIVNRRDEDSDE